MEAADSSETIYGTTNCHIRGEQSLNIFDCENFNYYTLFLGSDDFCSKGCDNVLRRRGECGDAFNF
jgi:hypothetical protein